MGIWMEDAMKTTLEPRREKQGPPLSRRDNLLRNEKAGSHLHEDHSHGDRSHEGHFQDGRHHDDHSHLWATACATGGAAVWAGMAVLARLGVARLGAIELLFLFAPLVIVPLGLELGRVLGSSGWLAKFARRLQPAGAAVAVVAMWLPPGKRATLFAMGWMLICAFVALNGVLELGRIFAGTAAGTTRVVMAIAQMDLAVGGAWLVASRWGMRPMGIQEPIGLLTAVHFHFAGFATAMIGAATVRFAEGHGENPWLKTLVLMVAGLPMVVAAGFVISPLVKMAAAILFSVSVAGWRSSCGLMGGKLMNLRRGFCCRWRQSPSLPG